MARCRGVGGLTRRPLPAPESIINARKLNRHVHFSLGQQDKLTEIGQRAVAILDRCFEQAGPAPRAFHDKDGFVEACRRRDARERLFRALFWQLASKEAERGRLKMEWAR